MTTTTTPRPALDRPAISTAAKATAVGLLVAAVGILVQFFALPDDFPTVPPGPIIVTAAAAFVVLGARWWWSPAVGVVVGLMIFIGGFLSGGVVDNLSDPVGPAVGASVMLAGLATAFSAGTLAVIGNRRS